MTMIELTSSYKVGDKIFSTFKEAQLNALTGVFDGRGADTTPAQHLLDHKDEVLAILSMSEPVKRGRKPRSDQGKPHAKKKAKAAQEPSETFIPGVKIEASEKYAGT